MWPWHRWTVSSRVAFEVVLSPRMRLPSILKSLIPYDQGQPFSSQGLASEGSLANWRAKSPTLSVSSNHLSWRTALRDGRTQKNRRVLKNSESQKTEEPRFHPWNKTNNSTCLSRSLWGLKRENTCQVRGVMPGMYWSIHLGYDDCSSPGKKPRA